MIKIGTKVGYRVGKRRRVGIVDAMTNNGGRLYRVNNHWFSRDGLTVEYE